MVSARFLPATVDAHLEGTRDARLIEKEGRLWQGCSVVVGVDVPDGHHSSLVFQDSVWPQ